MTPPTVLIFGAGAKTGKAIANAFHSKRYKLALASRSQDPATSTEDELHIPTDSYDGPRSSPTDVFDLPLEDLKSSTIVNILSPYAAAQQAIQGWKELPASSKPTFIYTGNCENVAPIPLLMALGVGKAGAASFIEVAANAYKDKGYKFYYADERLEDGSPMWNGVTAEGHAALYAELAEGDEQLEWQQTFVTGLGYRKLPVPQF
ncbi:hypothetical protein FGRMN_3762 [Fusarium graminum]|nr:hypothetical protein FGRMN_3762 [Fusarium graminum]